MDGHGQIRATVRRGFKGGRLAKFQPSKRAVGVGKWPGCRHARARAVITISPSLSTRPRRGHPCVGAVSFLPP
eukprot:3951829-Pyramimonas_sp.AAC.1